MNSHTTAVVLLTTQYIPEQSEFYSQLSKYGYDFYTIVDAEEKIANPAKHHGVVQIADEVCKAVGLLRMNPTLNKPSPVCTWEKSIYFFSHVKPGYKQIWFIEYDVFVPNIDLIKDLDERFPEAEFLARKYKKMRNNLLEPWPNAHLAPTHLIPKPWARGMVCISRFSGDLINSVSEFMEKNNVNDEIYGLIEFIIHTIALRDKRRMETPREFNNVTFKHARKLFLYHQESDWQAQEISADSFYHPVKNYEDQIRLRLNYGNFTPAEKIFWKMGKNLLFIGGFFAKAPGFYVGLSKRYLKEVRTRLNY